MIIAVGHLSGWPIAVATEYATADVVVKCMEADNIHAFAPPLQLYQTIPPVLQSLNY